MLSDTESTKMMILKIKCFVSYVQTCGFLDAFVHFGSLLHLCPRRDKIKWDFYKWNLFICYNSLLKMMFINIILMIIYCFYEMLSLGDN